jgi:hypothetical protein
MFSLFQRVADDVTARLRAKITTAATEASRAAVEDAKKNLAPLIRGAAVLYAGLLMLLAAATLALARFVPPWVAALAVGLVVTAIGATMLASSRRESASHPPAVEHEDLPDSDS